MQNEIGSRPWSRNSIRPSRALFRPLCALDRARLCPSSCAVLCRPPSCLIVLPLPSPCVLYFVDVLSEYPFCPLFRLFVACSCHFHAPLLCLPCLSGAGIVGSLLRLACAWMPAALSELESHVAKCSEHQAACLEPPIRQTLPILQIPFMQFLQCPAPFRTCQPIDCLCVACGASSTHCTVDCPVHGWRECVSPSSSSLLLCNITRWCTVCGPPTGRYTG